MCGTGEYTSVRVEASIEDEDGRGGADRMSCEIHLVYDPECIGGVKDEIEDRARTRKCSRITWRILGKSGREVNK